MTIAMRKILVCVVAVFALSAVAAASASAALPEFAPAGGKFPVKFTTTSGPGVLETLAKHKVECKSDVGEGEFINSTESHITTKFKGCKEPATGVACNTSGAASGEIVTNPLTGKLVYINKAKKEVGALFAPTTSGGLYAEFECKVFGIGSTLKVKGSIVGKIEPPNKKTKDFTVTFSMPTAGMQLTFEPKEGEFKEDVMETEASGTTSFAYEDSGASGSAILLTAVEGEFKG